MKLIRRPITGRVGFICATNCKKADDGICTQPWIKSDEKLHLLAKEKCSDYEPPET